MFSPLPVMWQLPFLEFLLSKTTKHLKNLKYQNLEKLKDYNKVIILNLRCPNAALISKLLILQIQHHIVSS